MITNVIYDINHERLEVTCGCDENNKPIYQVVTRADVLNKQCADGCCVRHYIYNNVKDEWLHRWKGTYCRDTNTIIHKNKEYKSFAAFATAHYMKWRATR